MTYDDRFFYAAFSFRGSESSRDPIAFF